MNVQLVRPAGKGPLWFQWEKITRKGLVEPKPALFAVHLFHRSNSERLLPLSQVRRPSLRISLETLQNARNASSELLEAGFWLIIQRWSGRLQQLGDMEERFVDRTTEVINIALF